MLNKLDPKVVVKDSWLGVVAERTHLYIGYQDLQRRLLYVNPMYSSWFKLTPEEMLGKTLKEIAVSPEAYALIEPYETQALAGKTAVLEVKLPEPQADIVSFICEFIPHTDAKTGQVLGIISIAHDVTEKERFAAAAQTTEHRFRSLTNTIPQLMWTATGEGHIDFVNDRCLAYLGVTSIESHGKKWMESLHPDDRDAVIAAWNESIHSGHPFKMDYRLANEAGVYRWFLGHAIRICNDAGKIQYWIGTATDIEDERQRENELKKAKLMAEDANRAKNEFLANMSHEIRTPLGAVLGFSQLLKEDISPAEKEHFAEIIQRNGALLTRIIDDLLDLARIEAGRFVIDLVKFQLRDLLSDVVTLFKDKVEEKEINLTIDFDSIPLEAIESDPVRLRQILINLIGNAVKFTNKGEVSVHVEKKADSSGELGLSFVIKDTGCGLTESQASKLFQPFTQVDPSTTRLYGGTGLGLALSRRLAQALGGTVELRQFAAGQGCTFVASIRIKQPQAAIGIQTVSSHPSPAIFNDDFLKGIKVLIVDDSVDNLSLVKHLLTSKQAHVDTSTNATDAFELIRQKSYDLIILDLHMPTIDGHQTLLEFRRMGFSKPVIAYTARILNEQEKRSEATDFAYYLTKPLNQHELFTTVAKYGRASF